MLSCKTTHLQGTHFPIIVKVHSREGRDLMPHTINIKPNDSKKHDMFIEYSNHFSFITLATKLTSLILGDSFIHCTLHQIKVRDYIKKLDT